MNRIKKIVDTFQKTGKLHLSQITDIHRAAVNSSMISDTQRVAVNSNIITEKECAAPNSDQVSEIEVDESINKDKMV